MKPHHLEETGMIIASKVTWELKIKELPTPECTSSGLHKHTTNDTAPPQVENNLSNLEKTPEGILKGIPLQLTSL